MTTMAEIFLCTVAAIGWAFAIVSSVLLSKSLDNTDEALRLIPRDSNPHPRFVEALKAADDAKIWARKMRDKHRYHRRENRKLRKELEEIEKVMLEVEPEIAAQLGIKKR